MDPIDAQFRQVLTKCEPDAAFRIAAETRAYLTQRGIRLSGEQQTNIVVVQPGRDRCDRRPPSRWGVRWRYRSGRGDRHYLRLQVRCPGGGRQRSGHSQSNTPEVLPAALEQAVAESCAPRTRRHHSGRLPAPRSELVDPRSRFGRLGLSSDAVLLRFSRAPDRT
jgi:hypothetical protein